ncbi:MAG: peptidoglycan-binding protein [Acidimicrobiales bacterium]|nr:peptidoglycan-binding protein [Acidimicrobiales bacterium]
MTPIAGPPRATAGEAAAWAHTRGAHPLVDGVAPLYWTYAPQIGIRPEVAFCQAMLETGWLTFGVGTADGRGVDAGWHNPCGLKVAAPNPAAHPDAPEQHQRFPTWEAGVRAHLAHLAVYAGLKAPPGWAAPRTAAPWFRSDRWGKATTVEQLGGQWAPSPGYGTRLAVLVASLADTTPPDEEQPVVPGLTLITRSQMGWPATAAAPIDPQRLEHFAVHYSTGRTLGGHSDSTGDIVAWWANIRGYHMGPERRYVDVAYNWAVARHPDDPEQAIILEGRGEGRQGGHTLNWNSKAVAACFLGGDDPAVWDTTPGVARAFDWLIRLREFVTLRRPHLSVRGHREFPGQSTSCPGDELLRWLHAGRPVAPYPGVGTAGFGTVPVLPPAAAGQPTLRRGDSGPAVTLLQQRLVVHGWGLLLGPVDGQFGRRTEEVVRHHQYANGLPVDGVCGPETWGTLL